MSQEIEIEYKVMLQEEQYTRLQHALPFPKEPITQINYYFETEDFRLKEASSAIRIRKKGEQYVLTLKEPYAEAILETHDTLTEAEFESWINGQPIRKEHTAKQLANQGILASDLRYFGALTTERSTFTHDKIIYVLDKSFYNGQVDYELEIEAPTHEAGIAAMQALTSEYKLSSVNADPKIKRFFNTFIK